MSLKKRKDGRYEKSLTIDGKRHHFYGKTQKEANEKAFRFQKDSESPLFSDLAEEYYDDYILEHPSSARYVRAHIKPLCEWFGHRRVRDLTPKDFTSYWYSIADKSYKTVASRRSVRLCIYNFGIITHHLEDNPVEKSKIPSFLKKGKRELPEEEQIRLVKASADVPYSLIYLIALYTGLRRGEILRLQWKDIDFDRGSVRVSKAVYHDSNVRILKEPKTASGRREVPLLEPLREILEPKRGKPEEYVLGGTEPWTRANCQRRIESYRKHSGVTIGLHQLRHAYATILYEAGIDDRMAMELLGHANISTTRDIYTHISKSKKEDAAEKLNAFLKSSKV